MNTNSPSSSRVFHAPSPVLPQQHQQGPPPIWYPTPMTTMPPPPPNPNGPNSMMMSMMNNNNNPMNLSPPSLPQGHGGTALPLPSPVGPSGSNGTAGGAKSNRLCRHFLRGNCTWGNACRFSHDPTTAEIPEDLINATENGGGNRYHSIITSPTRQDSQNNNSTTCDSQHPSHHDQDDDMMLDVIRQNNDHTSGISGERVIAIRQHQPYFPSASQLLLGTPTPDPSKTPTLHLGVA